MLVRVKAISSEKCWYSDMLGEKFIAYAVPNSPFLWFSNNLHFYPEDIEGTNDQTGIINFAAFAIDRS